MPSLFPGMSDGVVEEITAYPQLVRLRYDVATKKRNKRRVME
jgi:hypothetical protein